MAIALLLASLGFAAEARAADFDVATLFASLAREKPSRAAFRETRVMALLDRPVESSGELAFTPPARLEKRTLKPRPESVIIDGDRVTLERGGKRQSFGLRDYPGVAVLVESIRSTLAGDLASLARSYSLALEGAPARWRLVLRPLDPAAAALAERIEIAGAEARVESVGIFQADGDRSLMTLAPLAR